MAIEDDKDNVIKMAIEDDKDNVIKMAIEDDKDNQETSSVDITLKKATEAKEDDKDNQGTSSVNITFKKATEAKEEGKHEMSKNPPAQSAWRRTFWLTHQIAEDADKELRVQTTLQELIYYLIFLVIFNIISFGTASIYLFYMSTVLENLFLYTPGDHVSFSDIQTMGDFWDYTNDTFLDSLWADRWYEAFEFEAPTSPDIHEISNLQSLVDFNNDTRDFTPEEMHTNILYQSKLLGLARLRQVRVRNDSCTVHEDFRQMFSTCYDYYSPDAEDTSPFRLGVGSAWNYASADDTGMFSYSGYVSTYGGGGYYVDLSADRIQTQRILANLKKNLWIDRATRAVFLDFTIYNPSTDIFSVIKLILELPPTGGVFTSASIRTLFLIRYDTSVSFFVLACEIIFLLYIIYFTLEEVRELIYFKATYFADSRTWLDLVLLAMSFTYMGFNVYRHFAVRLELNYFTDHQDEYAEFDKISYWQVQYENLEALTLFLYWVKLFRFIGFNKTMSQLSNTLSRCAMDLAGFSIMFFIVFCAFAELGYLLFGAEVERFSSFASSMFSLLRIILSDFNYEELERGNPVLGPLYFITYIFFVFFILLNMFLAIINDTYSEVKSEITIADEYEVTDFLQTGLMNILEKLGLTHKLPKRIEDEHVSYDKIGHIFRKCGFSQTEMDAFFTKYNISSADTVGEKQLKIMMEEIRGIRHEVDMVPGNKVLMRDKFKLLERRVYKVEDSVLEAIHKTDIILKRLSTIH